MAIATRALTTPPGAPPWRRLLGLLRSHVWYLVIAGIGLLLSSAVGLALPLLIGDAVGRVVARHDLGLDKPLYVQYGTWVAHAVRGDLGESYRLNRGVAPEVLATPATPMLTTPPLTFASPEKVLEPVSVCVPLPAIVTPPVPEITPA